jgi:hypothetical protein
MIPNNPEVHNPVQAYNGRKGKCKLCDKPNKAVAKANKGPVVPIIAAGCALVIAYTIPDTAVLVKASTTPI